MDASAHFTPERAMQIARQQRHPLFYLTLAGAFGSLQRTIFRKNFID
jgi:hypothetical protein